MTINNHQLQHILRVKLNWPPERRNAVTEHFTNPELSFYALQAKYCPTHKFTVSRDVKTVERIYSDAFNIINAEYL